MDVAPFENCLSQTKAPTMLSNQRGCTISFFIFVMNPNDSFKDVEASQAVGMFEGVASFPGAPVSRGGLF